MTTLVMVRAVRAMGLLVCLSLASAIDEDWTFGPCVRSTADNPVLEPRENSSWFCPLQGREVRWEAKDVFNPAAVVFQERLHLLYRAEDHDGRYAGTSRIGLAISDDGVHFADVDRGDSPIFYPDLDEMKQIEWEGGIEDPRIVQDEAGLFVMTYTAYDGHIARLCVATSRDLRAWRKHGSAFKSFEGGRFVDVWTKSGSIVSKLVGEQVMAARINGLYWMYFGELDVHAAFSSDLINWSPVLDATSNVYRGHKVKGGKAPKSIFSIRKGSFDSFLVEPGPPALLTDRGIVFIYNSKNEDSKLLPKGTYSAGQVLLDAGEPSKVLARTTSPFFKPAMPYEITGQVGNVVFLEGLAYFKGRWLLYYGTADSKIAVAKCAFPQLGQALTAEELKAAEEVPMDLEDAEAANELDDLDALPDDEDAESEEKESLPFSEVEEEVPNEKDAESEEKESLPFSEVEEEVPNEKELSSTELSLAAGSLRKSRRWKDFEAFESSIPLPIFILPCVGLLAVAMRLCRSCFKVPDKGS